MAAAFALSLGACNKTEKAENAIADEDTAVLVRTGETAGEAVENTTDRVGNDFDDLNFDVPEIKLSNPFKGLSLRGNDAYGYYALGENVLFDTDKASISSEGAKGLQEVVKNIGERYPSGKVRIYGFADTTGTVGYNKALSAERAKMVEEWMMKNANMTAENMSIQAMGEKNPIPGSNAESRRVVIVAKKGTGDKM